MCNIVRSTATARSLFRVLAVASLLSLAAQSHAAPSEAKTTAYLLGIFPYLAPRQIVELFGPVAASMEGGLKHPVRLESTASFPEFSRTMAAGRFDIALIQPFDYPLVVDKLGYIPLAQMSEPLVTQFFVRDDSHYRKIEDLRGTTLALPPAESANARMSMRALRENQLIPGSDVRVNYFNSHDSCIQQVWAGTASACGTAKRPVIVFERRMQAKLRAIHDTPPIPPVLYVAHPRVPAAQRIRLQELIVGWSQTEAGRALLDKMAIPGYVVANSADYAMMRDYDPAAAVVKKRR